jgi:hypothetical protein
MNTYTCSLQQYLLLGLYCSMQPGIFVHMCCLRPLQWVEWAYLNAYEELCILSQLLLHFVILPLHSYPYWEWLPLCADAGLPTIATSMQLNELQRDAFRLCLSHWSLPNLGPLADDASVSKSRYKCFPSMRILPCNIVVYCSLCISTNFLEGKVVYSHAIWCLTEPLGYIASKFCKSRQTSPIQCHGTVQDKVRLHPSRQEDVWWNGGKIPRILNLSTRLTLWS